MASQDQVQNVAGTPEWEEETRIVVFAQSFQEQCPINMKLSMLDSIRVEVTFSS